MSPLGAAFGGMTSGSGQMPQGAGSQPPEKVEVPCLDTLSKTALFARLNREQLRAVTPPCHQLPTCSDTVFFSKGDEVTQVYIVLDGLVCLEEELFLGHHLPVKTILVERVGKNGVFGLCALRPGRASLTARCSGEAKIIAVDIHDLRALMRAHPDIGLVVMENVFDIMWERLRLTQHRIVTELGLAAMYESHRNY